MERAAYTEKELASQIGICQRGLAKLRKDGLIKAVKLGKHWVYPKSEVDKFFVRNLGKEISTKEKPPQGVGGLTNITI